MSFSNAQFAARERDDIAEQINRDLAVLAPVDVLAGLREYPARVAAVVRDLLPILFELERADKAQSLLAYGLASRKLALTVRRLKRADARAFSKAVTSKRSAS